MVDHADGQRRPLNRGLTIRMFDSMEEAWREANRRNAVAEEKCVPIRYRAVPGKP